MEMLKSLVKDGTILLTVPIMLPCTSYTSNLISKFCEVDTLDIGVPVLINSYLQTAHATLPKSVKTAGVNS